MTSTFGKVTFFAVILMMLIGIFLGTPDINSVVNSIRDSDIYYEEVGYKPISFPEHINLDELEMYYGGDNAEIDLSNLMVGDSTNFVFANLNGHSLEKHGAKALLVINCINKNGGILQVTNPDTNRTAIVCIIKTTNPKWEKYNDKFGVGIFESNSSTVTAFVKEKINSMTGLFRYLYNRGYTINNPFIP